MNRVGWSADHGSLDMAPHVARSFGAQDGGFESLGREVERYDLDTVGLEGACDVLAWYRVTSDTAPVHENDRDRLAPSLREKQEWFAGLTGADFAAAEDYRLRLRRDGVAAFESYDVLVWPTDLTDPYRHDDSNARTSCTGSSPAGARTPIRMGSRAPDLSPGQAAAPPMHPGEAMIIRPGRGSFFRRGRAARRPSRTR